MNYFHNGWFMTFIEGTVRMRDILAIILSLEFLIILFPYVKYKAYN